MSCIIVPAAEAIVTTVAAHILESREKKSEKLMNVSVHSAVQKDTKTPFSRKVKWLSRLLWGGSFLLGFEHVWHGEIQPFFPFLTAAENPESLSAMLHEMAAVGVGMALTVTAVWVGMLAVSGVLEKRADIGEELAGETA